MEKILSIIFISSRLKEYIYIYITNMIRYIFLFIIVLIIILIMVYSIDNICIFEHFENINYRDCRLYKNSECNSKYSNLSKIQLIHKYIENNKNGKITDNSIIKNIYNNPKPCYYNLHKLKEINIENNKLSPFKILDNEEHISSQGATITKGDCYFRNDTDISLYKETTEPSFNLINKNVNFRNLNHDKLKKSICDHKNLFLKDIQNLPRNISYKIQLKVNDNLNFDKEIFDILFQQISTVKYNNNSFLFEPYNDTNNQLDKLFSLSYDTNSIYFVPRRISVTFLVFSKNICNNYVLEEKFENEKFDLSMLGFKNESLKYDSNIDFNIQLNQDNDVYNLLSSDYDLEYSKDKINKEIDTLNHKIIHNKQKEYNICKDKKERQSHQFTIDKIKKIRQRENITALQQNIKSIEKQILDINQFLKGMKDNNIDYNFEHKIMKHCKYKLDNKTDIKALYNDFAKCQNNLDKVKNRILNENEIDEYEIDNIESEYLKSQLDELQHQLNEIQEFKDYVDDNNLHKNNNIPNNITHQLNNYSNNITDYCNINSSKGKTILKMQDNLSKISNIIDNATIPKDLIKNMKNNKISNHLLKYVSEDDCIYFFINQNIT